MPARILNQSESVKELFRQKIQEKISREKEALQERLDEELPSWLAWALKPVAGLNFELLQGRDRMVGRGGEIRASLSFWLMLPGDWILINDVVLEPEPQEFIQIDHVLIGSPGVYLIETKAWEGAFLGYKDVWKRKDGSSWVGCESPTRQNQRHELLFAKWAAGIAKVPFDSKEWLFPIVLFTHPLEEQAPPRGDVLCLYVADRFCKSCSKPALPPSVTAIR
ncbi:MAG: NERD domain-containing protein [Firmicutes bacterium]|nr:NERD domain-containing protein [Bacillota bacterium]MCL5039605.1 NERD domain-containing protein [Bacillota bacterium]